MEVLSSQLQSELDQINFQIRLEGRCLPIWAQAGSSFHAVPSHSIRSHFLVVFHFLTTDCSPCLYNEITAWNDFAAAVDRKTCQVIGVTDTYGLGDLDDIKRSLNIKFSLIKVDSLKSKLNKFGVSSTPVVLFGDTARKKCLYAFFPTPSNKPSDAFVKKLQLILEDCYH
jgi:hypothetical protein